MKYQCIHQDTGLCETCFNYESRLSAAEKVVDVIRKYYYSKSDSYVSFAVIEDAMVAYDKHRQKEGGAEEDYSEHDYGDK